MKQIDIQLILKQAIALHQQGRLSEAEMEYKKVLQIKPDDFTSNHMLGVIAQQRGQYQDAITYIKTALKISPANVSACSNLGVALMNVGLLDEAADYLMLAISQKPDFADAQHNLSTVRQAQGLYEQALDASLKAVSLTPDNALFNNTLANAYHESGQMQSALEYYDKAIALNPEYARAHTNRGISLLLSGKFKQGYAEYQQWRFKQPNYKPLRSSLPTCAEWQGECLDGKTLLLLSEQGLGDSFQFVRYADLLKQLYDCRVVLACQDHLLQIFKSVKSIDVLISKGAELPQSDFYASVMALPAILKEEQPYRPESAYLFADEILSLQWKKKLASFDGFNIGLAWKGSESYTGDHKRSFSPEMMAPLSRLKGINWFCLQMDYTEAKLKEERSALNIHCYPELDKNTGGFMDTAALMVNMDMVITSDTSLAHLAGALGVKTCVALCWVPDWRWQFEGEYSHWYSTMHLFRQQQSGDWNGVFNTISEYLAEKLINV